MKVLLTDAQQRTCLYVARSLGKRKIEVFMGENAWLSPHFLDPTKVLGFRSNFCKGFFFYPHPADTSTFISYMTKLAKKYDALIPISEDTIIPICENAEKFNNVLLPNFQDLEVALDKKSVTEKCLKLGIPTPQTFFPDHPSEVEKLADRLNYPAIVKWRREQITYPRYRICNSKKDLIQAYETMHRIQKNPLIQEQIEGFGTGFFALFDNKHRLKAYFIHRRIREFPISGGPSSCCESFWNKQVLEYGLKLLKALNWIGIGMVEFKFDRRDGAPKVMEINPRFWGSLPLAILSGVDFPYLLFRLITGEDFSPILQYRLNVKCRMTNDVMALWHTLRHSKNKLEAMKTIISSIPIKYVDFDFEDPPTSLLMIKPILKSIATMPKQILGI